MGRSLQILLHLTHSDKVRFSLNRLNVSLNFKSLVTAAYQLDMKYEIKTLHT